MIHEMTDETIMADASRLHTEAHASARAVLDVQGLGKHVTLPGGELTILEEVGFRIGHGDTVAIVGASGSGKSTLLSIIAGLDTPSRGTVHMAGVDLFAQTEDQRAAFRAAHLGFVFQSFQLLANLTALENVMLPLELAGRRDARAAASRMLERVGLGQRLSSYPKVLSGGEQQRVALARAFAPGPRLLLADEPTGNLDATTGAAIIEVAAREIAAFLSRFIIFSVHWISLVESHRGNPQHSSARPS